MQGSSTTWKQNQGISNYPMHASFSFHHSNLQLACTTQAWNFNLRLVPCKHIYVMHIQMQHASLWVCSPYLCAQILIDPLIFIFLSLCHLFTIFVHFFSPFVINDHKGSILDRYDYQRQSMGWGSFSQIWSNLEYLLKIFNSIWSKNKLLHTLFQGLSWRCWVKHL
jgi:hypothetical protein